MRRFALFIAGVLAVLALATWWYLARDPEPVRPTQAEKIISFCSKLRHQDSPLCTVKPNDPEAVEKVIEDAIERQTIPPQVIERGGTTVIRGSDSDDDGDSAPRVRVINPPNSPAPSSRPTPRPTTPPRTTRPPLAPDIEIPDIPAAPEIPLPEELSLLVP